MGRSRSILDAIEVIFDRCWLREKMRGGRRRFGGEGRKEEEVRGGGRCVTLRLEEEEEALTMAV